MNVEVICGYDFGDESEYGFANVKVDMTVDWLGMALRTGVEIWIYMWMSRWRPRWTRIWMRGLGSRCGCRCGWERGCGCKSWYIVVDADVDCSGGEGGCGGLIRTFKCGCRCLG